MSTLASTRTQVQAMMTVTAKTAMTVVTTQTAWTSTQLTMAPQKTTSCHTKTSTAQTPALTFSKLPWESSRPSIRMLTGRFADTSSTTTFQATTFKSLKMMPTETG